MEINQAVELFKNHNIKIDEDMNRTEVVGVLMNTPEEELWPVFDDLKVEGAVGFSANGKIRRHTLAYALMYAYENGLDKVDQSVIDQSLQKATALCEGLFGKESANREHSAIEETPNSEDISVAPRAKRSKNLYPEVLALVTANNDITPAEVCETLGKRYAEKSESTFTQYYYKARKELGLGSSGKRGRKKSDTFDKVKAVVQRMMSDDPSLKVSAMKSQVVEELSLVEATAQVYVYKARKEILAGS